MKTKIDWTKFIQLYPSHMYFEIFEYNEYNLVESEIENKTVFDIGANVGIFTCFCLELGAKLIYSVEAQPSIFRSGLDFNMKKYRNVIPLNLAVTKDDGNVVLIPNNFIMSHIDVYGEPVKTISLETLLNKSNDDDLILKMDIEGCEYESILNTKDEILKRCKFIHMEIHPNDLGFDSIRNKIKDCNFKLVNSAPSAGGAYIDKWIRS